MPLSASSSGMALFPRHVSKRPRFESTTVFTPNKRGIRMDASFIWWGKVDSNHRRHCQQIYSLSHLATLEFPRIQLRWSWWTDSNPRPADYKSAALPTELHQHDTGSNIIAKQAQFVNSYFCDRAENFHKCIRQSAVFALSAILW